MTTYHQGIRGSSRSGVIPFLVEPWSKWQFTSDGTAGNDTFPDSPDVGILNILMWAFIELQTTKLSISNTREQPLEATLTHLVDYALRVIIQGAYDLRCGLIQLQLIYSTGDDPLVCYKLC